MEIAPFVQGGATTILVGVIWYLLRQISSGAWVPQRELDYLRADRDARLAEKDQEIARALATAAEYRAAHETSERARELLADQVRDVVDALRTGNRFFDTFRGKLDRWDDGERTADGH